MVYPGHVALHFQGVDIETTNGTFAHYANRKEVTYVPIHEIVSINLLDTTDTNFQRSLVNPEVLLQSARLAYVVSSHRQIVKKNLEAAYQQTVQSLLKNQDYKKALTYARQSNSFELLELVSHNGAVFYIHQHDYQKARNFAHYSSKKQQLSRSIDQSEAAYLYNAHRYQEALRIYERLGDKEMVKQTYRALYGEAQKQLQGIKTVDQLKPHAGTIRTMERYAKASGDSELQSHVQSLAKHL
jgi:tetratricopeptide (TPR) repeat protein